MLPKASVSFTIPSLHDGMVLSCRLYYPAKPKEKCSGFKLKAAVLAHPYATLGGSYDDPVVAIAGKALLKRGYIVMTFNFRGARGSAGRTSWSGNPELADYVSVYGFMLFYLHTVRASIENETCPPTLILGGYSYGSMIVSHLPDLQVVLNEFGSEAAKSPEGEIRCRALELSEQYIALQEAQQQELDSLDRGRQSLQSPISDRGRQSLQLPGSPPHSVALGGSDSASSNHRHSRESSRTSFEGVRRSLRRIRHKDRTSSGLSFPDTKTESPKQQVPDVRICYLLVSPLLAPAASFTTMFSKPSFAPQSTKKLSLAAEADHELLSHPTCAVYGDEDVFTSHKKLRRWIDDCKQKSTSEFTSFEVAHTGHFWHEANSEERLKDAISEWVGKLGSAG